MKKIKKDTFLNIISYLTIKDISNLILVSSDIKRIVYNSIYGLPFHINLKLQNSYNYLNESESYYLFENIKRCYKYNKHSFEDRISDKIL